MNAEAKVYYGKKFFGHLTPGFQVAAVEAALDAQPVRTVPFPSPRPSPLGRGGARRRVSPLLAVALVAALGCSHVAAGGDTRAPF